MDRDQDVEVELYEENVGNLNYSTPTGSRSSSQDRFLPVLSSQEPTQRRLEEIPFVAIDPRPDPEELSHAPTSQVPRIHDSCHITHNSTAIYGSFTGCASRSESSSGCVLWSTIVCTAQHRRVCLQPACGRHLSLRSLLVGRCLRSADTTTLLAGAVHSSDWRPRL